MNLEKMLADQLEKLIGEKVPADAASKADVQAMVDAVKAELPALVKAAVAEATPVDRVGVGTKAIVAAPAATLEDDPAAYLLEKAGRVKSTDEYTPAEKAIIYGITYKYLVQGMTGAAEVDE